MNREAAGVLDTRWSLSSGSQGETPWRGCPSGLGRRYWPASRLLLHILDTGECDALGALAGIAEIEFILGQEHRIAVDIVGDAGAVGGDERVELLAIVG